VTTVNNIYIATLYTFRKRLDKDNLEDFVDILLAHLEEAEPESMLTMEQVLFELEDFLGGHSAVSNLVGRAIVEIATVAGLSKTIYEQVSLKNQKCLSKSLTQTSD